ncbi:hypothetical protein T4D_13231 [Trichinella pseudospiralis]|uniref:Transmembrane protein n=1 Tax=Trichinella pseudospiralis TaxID=6337 RepID=A0A0V1FQG3_TRIPS|nr:hypothetical protein T4D_13231 [Trichinella pseudospiralis]
MHHYVEIWMRCSVCSHFGRISFTLFNMKLAWFLVDRIAMKLNILAVVWSVVTLGWRRWIFKCVDPDVV